MRKLALFAAVLTLAAFAVVPAEVRASPWTLPRGEGVIYGGFSYEFANTEFFEEGGEQVFPLDGHYTGASFTLGARVGFTDDIELELDIPLRIVSFDADPVILLERTGPEPELDYYQDNVLDLSSTTSGVGDLTLAGRYRVMARPMPLALELRIKAPTGYDGPSGTFGDEPKTAQEFLDRAGELARPQNVRDDVTLGDGTLDIAASVLLGYSFPTRTFVRLDAGYNLRFGGGADQILASLRLGQAFLDRFVLYAGGQLAYSVEDGDVIGISVRAIDPRLPARDYTVGNINPVPVRLGYDALTVGGGVIWKVTDRTEINVGYNRIVWGRTVAAVNSISVTLALRTDFDGEEPEAAAAPEPQPQPEPQPAAQPVAPEPEPEPQPAQPAAPEPDGDLQPGDAPLQQPDA